MCREQSRVLDNTWCMYNSDIFLLTASTTPRQTPVSIVTANCEEDAQLCNKVCEEPDARAQQPCPLRLHTRANKQHQTTKAKARQPSRGQHHSAQHQLLSLSLSQNMILILILKKCQPAPQRVVKRPDRPRVQNADPHSGPHKIRPVTSNSQMNKNTRTRAKAVQWTSVASVILESGAVWGHTGTQRNCTVPLKDQNGPSAG